MIKIVTIAFLILCLVSICNAQPFKVAYICNDSDMEPVVSSIDQRFFVNSYGMSGIDGKIFNVPWYITQEEYAGCNMYDPYDRFISENPEVVDYYAYVWVGTTRAIAKFPWEGSPGLAWSTDPGNAPHETAHAIGIQHYHSIACSTSTIDSTCYATESGGGDFSGFHHVSAAVKEEFGWLNVDEVGDGTYEIFPIEVDSGLRGVKVYISDITVWGKPYDNWLYIWYRQPIGIDAGTTPGVVIDYVYPFPPPTNVYRLINHFDCFQIGDRSIGVEVLKEDSESVVVSVNTNCVPAPQECEPLPDQYRTLSCMKGYRGSVFQERVSTCPGPTWGTWVTVSDTCVKRGRK